MIFTYLRRRNNSNKKSTRYLQVDFLLIRFLIGNFSSLRCACHRFWKIPDGMRSNI